MAGIFSDLKVQYFILVLKKSKFFFVAPAHCVSPVPQGGVGPEGTDPGLTTSWVAPEACWRRGTHLEDPCTDSLLKPYQMLVCLTGEESKHIRVSMECQSFSFLPSATSSIS